MAYNEKRTEQVRQALAHIPDVQERKMFGSFGFMVNGKLCIGVGDHEDHVMMVRVGPEVYEKALQRKGARPAIMRGQERKGYIFLLEEAVKTQEDLDYWVGLALDFNKRLN
ncbi:MAG TPA: TfoX/Sxy family protein [Patescibacteria group bacterium]|nr:TfoX/Sxy family protein [Patescibacteria group bacterium]